jgi:two-component system, response regulator YesN
MSMDESTLPTGVNPPVKILIVDDHPNTATTLARALARLGTHVQVASATSGSEALKLVENGKADILITDMNMPELTGLELIEALSKQSATCPTFIFLMTAYDTSGLSERLQQLKVQEVITKPVNPERICQIVSQALEEMKQPKSVTAEPVLDKANPLEPTTENNADEQDIAMTVETEMEKSIQVK